MTKPPALLFVAVLVAPIAIQAQQSPQQTQPSQVQACLATLPKAPKPPAPQPARPLFPGIQQRLDDMVRKAGGDPDAMRAAAAQAAQAKYQAELAAYVAQRQSCFVLPTATVPTPVAPSATPSTLNPKQ